MPKTFISEPQPLTTHEGGQARFSCQIYAVPPADISWYKDGIKLPQNNSRYIGFKYHTYPNYFNNVEKFISIFFG